MAKLSLSIVRNRFPTIQYENFTTCRRLSSRRSVPIHPKSLQTKQVSRRDDCVKAPFCLNRAIFKLKSHIRFPACKLLEVGEGERRRINLKSAVPRRRHLAEARRQAARPSQVLSESSGIYAWRHQSINDWWIIPFSLKSTSSRVRTRLGKLSPVNSSRGLNSRIRVDSSGIR